MKFGLRESDLDFIVRALREFKEINRAAIFGSRAKNTHKPGSDIDIAVFGDKVDFDTIAKLHYRLEETSPLPYFFDIVDYSHLKQEELKEHIDRVGVVIYEQKSEEKN